MKLYLTVFELCDVFREINSFKKRFMRYQSRPYTATKMDFFHTSNGLRQRIQSGTSDKALNQITKLPC